MQTQIPQWIGQMRVYDEPQRVDGVWCSPLGGRNYELPRGVTAVYGHDCAGQPIISPARAGDKYRTSMDSKGYRRRRGLQEVVVRYQDGAAVLGMERDGEWRGFRRGPEHERTEAWYPDPSALREAFTVAGLDVPAAGGERWSLVTHQGKLKQWIVAFLGNNGGAGLYLHGGTGSGKTTATKAIIEECRQNGRSVLYLDVPDWARRLRASYSDVSAATQVHAENSEAQRVDLLVLDDLTAVPRKDDLWLTLHTLIDRRQSERKPTVVADNCPPSAWESEKLDKRLASRLHALKALDFGQRDWRKEPAK